jgi:putative heme iron utilization protein
LEQNIIIELQTSKTEDKQDDREKSIINIENGKKDQNELNTSSAKFKASILCLIK